MARSVAIDNLRENKKRGENNEQSIAILIKTKESSYARRRRLHGESSRVRRAKGLRPVAEQGRLIGSIVSQRNLFSPENFVSVSFFSSNIPAE